MCTQNPPALLSPDEEFETGQHRGVEKDVFLWRCVDISNQKCCQREKTDLFTERRKEKHEERRGVEKAC